MIDTSVFIVTSLIFDVGAIAVLLYSLRKPNLKGLAGITRPGMPTQSATPNSGLVMCPRCFRSEYPTARFCDRCGSPMQFPAHMAGVENRYTAPDELNSLLELTEENSRTRVGNPVSVQDQEPFPISQTPQCKTSLHHKGGNAN
jgi:hypothetical protein